MSSSSSFDVNTNLFPEQIRVLFASQSGQAESISEFIFDHFDTTGVLAVIKEKLGSDSVQRICVSQFDSILDTILEPKNSDQLLPGSYLLIIVASTTGQGDPPDKAIKFFRWLRRLKRSASTKSNGQPLKHLSYALLGLGDTNYDNFANFSKQLDKHFVELGASTYIFPSFADDAVGLELVTEPFIEHLTTTLLEHFNRVYCSDKVDKKVDSQISILDTSSEQLPIDTDNSKIAQSENEDIEKSANQLPTKLDTKTLEQEFDTNMNLDRPVVSSCHHLSSSDKRNLSDVCRQLIEPSIHLSTISDDELSLPKLPANSDVDDVDNGEDSASFIYNKKNFELKSEELKELLLYDYLKSKVLNKASLYEGQVVLDSKLSSECESPKCCHKEKIVLECRVNYNVPNSTHKDSSENCKFVPGDAFGIYSSNLLVDIYQVLLSVTVKDMNNDESILLWDYFKCNKKQVYVKLNDKKSVVQLLPYLVYGVDLRSLPKKVALYHLSKFTTDKHQKRRLMELSSRQANQEYQELILGHKVTFCDILRLFDTCHPPINVLLSHLISARPRYFSAASIPKVISHQSGTEHTNHNGADGDHVQDTVLATSTTTCSFKILFTVSNNFSHTFMRASENLLGQFSGKFCKHYNFVSKNFLPELSCDNVWKSIELIQESVSKGQIFDNQDVPLHKSLSFPVYVFPRINNSFKINGDLSKHLILISTGTGIAPFLSYLEYRENALKSSQLSTGGIEDSIKNGCLYFLFGCRNPYQDFVYSDRIISYTEGKLPVINHLCLCFSRSTRFENARFEMENNVRLCDSMDGHEQELDSNVKHVDQLIELHGNELAKLIIEQNASVYVCGDWKKLSKGIATALCTIFDQYHFGMERNQTDQGPSPSSVKYLKQMQSEGRYVLDIWT